MSCFKLLFRMEFPAIAMAEIKLCARCNKPVEENAESYDVFEQMHWLCFHLEFEHEGDPDRACDDVSCPWWYIEVLRAKLTSLGHNPKKVIENAIEELCNNHDAK